MSYKNLTKDDVKRVAEALIKINGTTTTKDVKDQLRAEGYFAKQGGVSEMMATICDEEADWQYTFNGTYREYVIDGVHTASGPSASQALASHVGAGVSTASQVPAAQGNQAFAKFYVTKDGEKIDAIDNPSVGDWVCRDANVIKDTLYFDGDVSKDRARYAYCKIADVPHNDARIARHK